jgi:endonuclease G
MSLRSGEALGLHFAGRFLEANFAVSSSMVGERLGQVLNGRRPQNITPPTTPDSPSPLVQVRPWITGPPTTAPHRSGSHR